MQIFSSLSLLVSLLFLSKVTAEDKDLTYLGKFNITRDVSRMFNYTVNNQSAPNFGIEYYTQSYFTSYGNSSIV